MPRESKMYVSAWLPAALIAHVSHRAGKETAGNRSKWLGRAAAFAVQYMPPGWPQTTREYTPEHTTDLRDALAEIDLATARLEDAIQKFTKLQDGQNDE